MISVRGIATQSSFCAALAGALFLTGCGAAVDAGEGSDVATGEVSEALKCGPDVDPSIAVPDGNKLAFSFDAVGVQIYTCQPTVTPTATTYGWVFQAPEANLLNDKGRIVGTHYAGPTWQFKDQSLVKGTKLAGFNADPTAIPWLLLQASAHEGDGKMSEVTYIQRLDTSGGLAPATGCDAAHVGTLLRSDYAATYYFYKAKKGKGNGCDD